MTARTARTAKAATARNAKAATAKVPTISRLSDGRVILTDLPFMVAGLGPDGKNGRSQRVMGAQGLGWTFMDDTANGGPKGWVTDMAGAASLAVDTFALVGLEIVDLSGKGAKAAAPAKAATAKAATAKAATAKAATAKAATAKAATAKAAPDEVAIKITTALVAAGIDDADVIAAAIKAATAKAAPATAKAATAKAAPAKAAPAKAATHTVTVPSGTRVRAAIKVMRAEGAKVERDGRTLKVTGITLAKVNKIVADHAA